jgi:hypothetical protein
VNRSLVLSSIAAILVGPALYSLMRPDFIGKPETRDLTLMSNAYRLDKIYRSMEGPYSIQSDIQVPNGKTSPFQWVTGLETKVVDATEPRPISQEFFCHSNLTFAERGDTPSHYNQRFGGKTHLDWRLFTLVPGRLSIELPEGFGMLVPTEAPLDYFTMSLNMNARSEPVNVRLCTSVHTIAADAPGAPTKALFRRALYVLQPQDQAASTVTMTTSQEPHHVGAGCADSCKVNFSAVSTVGTFGQGKTPHWIVPQGRHIYRTDITPQLNLPFNTTIHYATIHVHPFARAMELRDLTSSATVFRLNSQDWPDRLGVAHVDELKSIKGIPIYRDHHYEVTAEYDNTSDSKTDAMAILYLYLLEKDLT